MVKIEVGRGRDQTELMNISESKSEGENAILRYCFISQIWEVLVLGKEPEYWGFGLLRGL